MDKDDIEKEAEEKCGEHLQFDYTEDEAMAFEIGYIAGAKAHSVKWHKVADGDLPKIGKPCLAQLVNDDAIIASLREDNVWTTNGYNAFENVIAWCEIPKYIEEE